MSLKKRHDLPPFKELDKTFDVEKIIKVGVLRPKWATSERKYIIDDYM